MAVLGVWAAPSPMDRVDGFYLASIDVADQGSATAKKTTRDAAAARAAVVKLIEATAAPGADDQRRDEGGAG